jgi:hypothetical protein
MRAAISVWLSSLSRRARTSSSISSRRRPPVLSRPGNEDRRADGGIAETLYPIRYTGKTFPALIIARWLVDTPVGAAIRR